MNKTFLDDMPDRIKALPVDHRGFPVPWFVAWINGKPDHRCVDKAKIRPAILHRRCWLCGQSLGAYLTFPIGPMCAVTRTTSEPPSHRDCAEFAAKVCPFLTIPAKKRRDSNLPDTVQDPPGEHLAHNPGALALWICKRYESFTEDGGLLFSVGDPTEVVWYCEGRAATRQEVDDSIMKGLPHLIKLAEQEGDWSLQELQRQLKIVRSLLPLADDK